jgi:guanine nucleotide-binding protein alpha-1 subunit
MTLVRSRHEDDPISLALRPPITESVAEREARLQLEAEALRISQRIDEQIRLDREKLKKSKTDIKVDVKLLLSSCISSSSSTASPPWSSWIWQEHSAETVPAHV